MRTGRVRHMFSRCRVWRAKYFIIPIKPNTFCYFIIFARIFLKKPIPSCTNIPLFYCSSYSFLAFLRLSACKQQLYYQFLYRYRKAYRYKRNLQWTKKDFPEVASLWFLKKHNNARDIWAVTIQCLHIYQHKKPTPVDCLFSKFPKTF